MSQPVKSESHAVSLASLRDAGIAAQTRLGCVDTLREILQQPATWRQTADLVERSSLHRDANGASHPTCVVLTGSGSSVYAGECIAPALQKQLAIPCSAIAAGTLLADDAALPPLQGGLLVSIARSGDSPESVGVVDAVLAQAPTWRHLVITCHARGKLATRYADESRVRVVLLDPATNDRSLVMTSSFTNLVLAGSALGLQNVAEAGHAAADVADALITRHGDALAAWGARKMPAMACLGDGALLGAAHETALKLLEMSAGAVRVLSETSLGLRHGPMAWLHNPSQLVAFLSGDGVQRAYEIDLLKELTHKRLAPERVVVGEKLDPAWVGPEGLGVELPGLYGLPPPQQAMVHVVAGQLLALFHCLALGQKPDAPSSGVLTRVVEAFPLHRGHAV